MTKDNLIFAEDARKGLMDGVRKISRAVGVTMGTSGKNSVIETFASPFYDLTNDGETILTAIKLADPLEELGRKFLAEAVSRENKNSGDGSSTTCVLTAAILEEGMNHLKEASPMEIKRSLEACIPILEESLKKQAKKVSVHNVWQTAAVSAEDEEIGKRIGEIYKKIGKDGIIQWESAKVPNDSYEIGTGIRIFDAGYVTPYLTDADPATGWIQNEMRLKNVPVLIIKEKITNGSAFNQVFQELFEHGDRDVALFCDEITPEAVGSFINTRAQKGFRVGLIKLPVLWGDEWVEDLSEASGAKIVSKQMGLNILDLHKEDAGRLGNVLVKKDSVYIDGMKDLKQHLMKIQVEGEGNDASKLRVARLNTRTARYFVGGHSETAISHRRRKVEDAINAASEALDGGVVAGGGVALSMARTAIEGIRSVGSEILCHALLEPMITIMNNAGINGDIPSEDGMGYDTRNGKIVDMFKAGIVDPRKVVANAIKAAIGVAGGILTYGTVILMPQKEETGMVDPRTLMR